MSALKVSAGRNEVRIGPCSISFQRTLRVPERGDQPYPLPPTFGAFPLVVLAREPLRVGCPMYQREAMWIAFDCGEQPCAVMIDTGGINAISGESWNPGLRRDPQNYVVCPDQPWLDGFSTGEAIVRQFVAMPLGSGYTAGEQLAGSPSNELHFLLYRARRGVRRPQRKVAPVAMAPKQLGLAAGGRIHQRIYPDPYPDGTWDLNRQGAAEIVLLTTAEYRRITKREPPPSPIDAKTYAEHGFPWFELYDEDQGAVAGSERLAGLQSPGEVDTVAGRESTGDDRVNIKPDTIKTIRRHSDGERRRSKQ